MSPVADIAEMSLIADTLPDITEYRELIERALKHDRPTHSFEDVEKAVEEGRALFWPIGEHSVVLTEITEFPRFKCLHIWCAAGRMEDIERAAPVILDYGRHMGCEKATLVGRKGWLRSFLTKTGWTDTELVTMSKDL